MGALHQVIAAALYGEVKRELLKLDIRSIIVQDHERCKGSLKIIAACIFTTKIRKHSEVAFNQAADSINLNQKQGWENGCPNVDNHYPKSLNKENILFQQHKRRLYTWTSPNGQYRNQIDYILYSQRWRNCTQSAKTRPGADCSSGHQLLIEKFRLELKKAGKTTRPARYNLNQIPY